MRLIIPDLLPGTKYAIQVRGDNLVSQSPWSPIFYFTAVSDTILPRTPQNLSWIATGDSFHGEWDQVTTNVDGESISIVRYEVEMVGGSTLKVDSVPQNTGTGRVSFDLSFEMNRALFSTPQATVKFRVRAVDNKGLKSDWTAQATAQNATPAAPTNFAATSGQNFIDLSWTASPDNDIVGYNVYTGASGFTPALNNRIYSGASTRFVYPTSTYATQYFKVRAYDKFGQESLDASTSGAPTSPFSVDTTAPSVPTSLAVTITNNANGLGARAGVSWVMASPPSDLAGYYIRYRRVGDTNYSTVQFTKDMLAGTIELQAAYTNYEFQIKAFDWSNNESAWSATTTATSPSNAVPGNVSGLTATAGRDSIVYSWTPVSDADLKNYELTFSTSSTFASSNVTFFNGTGTTMTVSGLSPSTTYYARVRAVDIGGLVSAAWSSTVSVATGSFPSAPLSDGIAPTSSPIPTVTGGIGNLFVSWTAIVNADPVTYEVHISTTSGFTASSATKVAETSATTITLENTVSGSALSYGTTYYIKLIARDRDGSAAASSQSSAFPAQVFSSDIGNNTINMDKLAIADFTNLAIDGNFNLSTSWPYSASAVRTAPTGTTPGYLTMTKSATTNLDVYQQFFNVLPGESFYIVAEVYRESTNSTTATAANETVAVGINFQTPGGTNTWNGVYALAAALDSQHTDTFKVISGNVTAPTDVSRGRGWLVVNGATASGNKYRFRNIKIYRRNGGELIVDGTITANKLVTGTITAASGVIADAAITTAKIVDANITTAKIADLSVTNAKIADLSVTKLTAGTVGGGFGITMAAGSSILLNGGKIQSNTFNGTSAGSSTDATAGFYLGNDGLVIPQGKISANTLNIGGTITSGNIVLGGTGTAGTIQTSAYNGTSGFRLSSGGLEIPDGTLTASKLRLQSGAKNIVPIQLSTFAYPESYYSDLAVSTANGATGTAVVNNSKYYYTDSLGTGKSMKYTISNTTTANAYLEATKPGIGVPVEPNTEYIVSFYGYQEGGASADSTVGAVINGAYSGLSGTVRSAIVSGTASTTTTPIATINAWVRYSFVFATGATERSVQISPRVINPTTTARTNRVYYFDAIMVEQKMSSAQTPSAFNTGSFTTIDGGMIKTGSIQSNAKAQVSKVNSLGEIVFSGEDPTSTDWQPAWAIDTTGAASFGDLLIRGNVVVGHPSIDAGTETVSVLYTVNSGDSVFDAPTDSILQSDIGSEFVASAFPAGTVISGITSGVSDSTMTVSVTNAATSSVVSGIGTISRPLEYVSQMQSADYQQGESGWAIRSDGYAEFRNMAADSISIETLASGTYSGEIRLASGGKIVARDDITGNEVYFDSTGFYSIGANSQKFIELPNTGAPNIISGELRTSSLYVNGGETGLGATFSANSYINPSAAIVLRSKLEAPNAPKIDVTWDQITIPLTNGAAYAGLAFNDAGEVCQWRVNPAITNSFGASTLTFRDLLVQRNSPLTGATLGYIDLGAFYQYSKSTLGGVTNETSNSFFIHGMAYEPTTKRWGVLFRSQRTTKSSSGGGQTSSVGPDQMIVAIYDVNGKLRSGGYDCINGSQASGFNPTGGVIKSMVAGDSDLSLGVDYITNKFVVSYKDNSNNTFALTVTENGTGGITTASLFSHAISITGNSEATLFLGRGNFDFGAGRIVMRDYTNKRFTVYNSTTPSTVHSGNWWPSAQVSYGGAYINGYTAWDQVSGTFKQLRNVSSTSSVLYKYGSGTSATSGTGAIYTDGAMTKTWVAKASYYRFVKNADGTSANGREYSTDISSASTLVTVPSRSKVVFSLPAQIPSDGTSNTPSEARIWVSRASGTYLLAGSIPAGSSTTYSYGLSHYTTTFVTPVTGTPAVESTKVWYFPLMGASAVLRSVAIDGSGSPLVQLSGDGSFALGPIIGKSDGSIDHSKRYASFTSSYGYSNTESTINSWTASPETVNDNVSNMLSHSGGTFTFREAGMYQVTVTVPWQAVTVANSLMLNRLFVTANGWLRNEATWSRVGPSALASFAGGTATTTFYSPAGGTIYVTGYANGASASTITTYLRVVKMA